MHHQLTEEQATAEGLSVIDPGASSPAPVNRASYGARLADELAAAVDTLLTDPELSHRQRVALEVVLDGLGALHVDLDELAEEFRQVGVFAGLLGVAS